MSARIPPVLRPEHPLAAVPRRARAASSASSTRARSTASRSRGVTLSTGDLHPGDLYVGIARRPSPRGELRGRRPRAGGAVAHPDRRRGRRARRRQRSADPGRRLAARGARRDLGVGLPHRARTRRCCSRTTGTNGKTTTSYLLEAILRQLGLVTGLSSTAERHIGDLTVVSGSPPPRRARCTPCWPGCGRAGCAPSRSR